MVQYKCPNAFVNIFLLFVRNLKIVTNHFKKVFISFLCEIEKAVKILMVRLD